LYNSSIERHSKIEKKERYPSDLPRSTQRERQIEIDRERDKPKERIRNIYILYSQNRKKRKIAKRKHFGHKVGDT